MSREVLPTAFTQILYFTTQSGNDVGNTDSDAGQAWLEALAEVERSEGYTSLVWGRSVEQPTKLQLHIVRSELKRHTDWVDSASYHVFLKSMARIIDASVVQPVVRHVTPMVTHTSKPTTAYTAPVTGTAVYLRTTDVWNNDAWPRWTHLVRHVKGNSGIMAGKLLEPLNTGTSASLPGISAPVKDGQIATSNEDIPDAFIVYVGWESIKAHNDVHHTQWFRDNQYVLRQGNDGWREYGHIKFEGWRHVADAGLGDRARL